MASKEGDQRRLNVYLAQSDPVESLLLEMLDDRTRKQELIRRIMKAGVADLLDAHDLNPATLGLDPADAARVQYVRQRAEVDRIDAGSRSAATAPAAAKAPNAMPDELPDELPRSQPRRPAASETRPVPDGKDASDKPSITVEESVAGILGT